MVRLDPPDLDVAVALPHQRWSTQASRGVLPQEVSRADAVFNVASLAGLVACLASGQWAHLRAAMADRLHQPYRLPRIPGAQEAMAAGLEAGAWGSPWPGPARRCGVALTPPAAGEAVAQAMAQAFAATGATGPSLGLPAGGSGSPGERRGDAAVGRDCGAKVRRQLRGRR